MHSLDPHPVVPQPASSDGAWEKLPETATAPESGLRTWRVRADADLTLGESP